MDNKQLKQKIYQLLSVGKLPTTRIATSLHEGYWKTIRVLEEMEEEKLVIKINKSPYQIYWERAEGGNINGKEK